MSWKRAAFAFACVLCCVPAAEAQQPPTARIIVLATGGTIAGQASNRAAIGYGAGKVSGAALVAAIRRAGRAPTFNDTIPSAGF